MGASHFRGARVSGAACLLSLVAPPASTAPTEQDRLDAAMSQFDERMLAAGWPSPPDFPGGQGSGSGPQGSPVRDACGFDALGNVRSAPWYFPAEQARAFSDLYERQTEVLPAMHFEDAEALAVTVDDAGLDAIVAFVDAVGSPQHGQCMKDQADATAGREYIDVETQQDLGIGDQSARITWVNLEYTVGDYYLGDSYAVARVGSTVVMVWYSVVGQPYSAFDPVAELELINDSLS